ncbi:MAG: hypothetical protein R3F48_13145 [Candidatus Zixiibacteriota bacterium]
MVKHVRFKKAAILGVLLLFSFTIANAGENSTKPQFTTGLDIGYSSGFHIQMSGMVSDFAREFPLSFRASVGYSTVEPGDAAAARRIFINNATNGIPEEKGSQWELRFDLLYPVQIFSIKTSYLYLGPRYVRFKGNFKYIGGNEDFDVKSNQWGVGTGLESHFPMSQSVDLVLSGGLDYFPSATLTGHDTSYSPDEEAVNPREDYTFDDADEAINQPKLEPRLIVGIAYRF